MPKEYINWPQPERIPMDVSSSVKDLSKFPLDSVQQRQEWLLANGYEIGPAGADGVVGPFFVDATKLYQTMLKRHYGYLGDIDGIWGGDTRDAHVRYRDDVRNGMLVPPSPRVGIHWDGRHGTIQLSMDIDWDILQQMVKERQEDPGANWYSDDEGSFPNRVVFFTGALDRADAQRLIKHTRRARNDAFGVDE